MIVLGQEKVQPGGTLEALPTFLLDLETGARTPLPSLNNAATFSPDGRTLVAGIYTGSRLLRTEIVEYDLETKLMKFLASDAQGDWLPSYTPSGNTTPATRHMPARRRTASTCSFTGRSRTPTTTSSA